MAKIFLNDENFLIYGSSFMHSMGQAKTVTGPGKMLPAHIEADKSVHLHSLCKFTIYCNVLQLVLQLVVKL